MKNNDARRRSLITTMVAVLFALAAGPVLSFTLTFNTGAPSPQWVGTPVALQAAVSGADPGADIVYQFEIAPAGGTYSLLQAFHANASFNWAGINDGIYQLRVLARDRVSNEVKGVTIPFGRVSPAAGGTPIALPTAHPQVILHSSPPCPAGGIGLRVAFWRTGNPAAGINATNFKPCNPGRTVNHYVAGMVGNTSYTFLPQISVNGTIVTGTPISATTGTPPIAADTIVPVPASATTSLSQDFLLISYIGRTDNVWFAATDLSGQYVWSYANANLDQALLVRPVRGGTFLVSTTPAGEVRSQVLREIDLAGNTIRETNAAVLDEQLLAAGQDEMGGFHHEAIRLANGHTIVLVSVEREVDQGNGPELVYGEMVIDLDRNFNVAWSWNAFDHLDVMRPAVLGETCTNNGNVPQGGCPWLWNGSSAADWLHMNSINYSPADGHLILSARHQDAVFKIDYADGTGSGAVIWELGEHGDFALNGQPGVAPWFSHQHDARYFGNEVVIYDNGNTRQGNQIGATENSRGQSYVLDEVNMTADLVVNIDLDHYSAAVGSAQKLVNGNYFYHSGFLGSFGNPLFMSIETDAVGNYSWVEAGTTRAYRAFRMRTLFQE